MIKNLLNLFNESVNEVIKDEELVRGINRLGEYTNLKLHDIYSEFEFNNDYNYNNFDIFCQFSFEDFERISDQSFQFFSRVSTPLFILLI